MRNRLRRKAIVFLAIPVLAGCEVVAVRSATGTRELSIREMDGITVGSASATIDIAAHALAPDARTTSSASTLAVSGGSPMAGPSLLAQANLNYSSSQGAASATSDARLSEVNGSSHTSVSSANGGASIDATGAATAAGGGAGNAQLGMLFFGFSTSRADLVFGSANAAACCAPSLGAQVKADGAAGGPYSIKFEGYPLSDIPGQAQGRVEVAVASSALPIVDPGQVMGILIARGSPIY
jgi:hypothetical protein